MVEGLRLQEWVSLVVECDRCNANASSSPIPRQLSPRPGDIDWDEWCLDRGWARLHQQNHCPHCARLCREGTCPPQVSVAVRERS